MAANMTMGRTPLWRRMRWVVWGGAGCLLALPWVAMQFTREVAWSGADFTVMGVMLGLACAAFELAVRVARSHAYVLGAGVAVGTAFLLTWINLAVGIIGSENNPANLMFFGVLLVGALAVIAFRLHARGMALAMEATAVAQAAVSLVTLAIGAGHVFVLAAVFVVLWLVAAQLFRKAARDQRSRAPA